MKIALAQVNQIVGNIEKNKNKILSLALQAKESGADLIVFPEFALVGGYGEDLFENKDFIAENFKAMEEITSKSPINILCGTIVNDKLNRNLTNAVSLFADNDNMKTIASKSLLNDAEFNDAKYFKCFGFSNVFKINDKNIACIIADNPASIQKNIEKVSWLGIDIAVLVSCSAYYKGKTLEIKNILKQSAQDNGVDVAYVNMVGAQDGLIFDGTSLYVDKHGNFKALADSFEETLTVFDTDGQNISCRDIEKNKEIYDALVLGLKDYCAKNALTKCALGISGGIDSALTLAIAVDALGKDNVLGVLMPSEYTSNESNIYALELCKKLQVENKTIPIKNAHKAYTELFKPFFEFNQKDLTEENLQARIRCNILMALSNKFGYLILCTCNKSEDAVGYSTLYGDAAGGYSVIGDLLKKEVYSLSKYRNNVSYAIPEEIIDRYPTAELRKNQKDSDSLPEYDVLDDILEKILDKKMSYNSILESGVDKDTLEKTIKLVYSSEYKRRQSPITAKISKSAFSRDIILPVSNGYIWNQTIKNTEKE